MHSGKYELTFGILPDRLGTFSISSLGTTNSTQNCIYCIVFKGSNLNQPNHTFHIIFLKIITDLIMFFGKKQMV